MVVLIPDWKVTKKNALFLSVHLDLPMNEPVNHLFRDFKCVHRIKVDGFKMT